MTILLLRLLLSFCFDWEDISNTRDSVSSAIQTPRISSKILRCASYFQLSSRCLDIPMKHCRSCLIYYIKNPLNKSDNRFPFKLCSLNIHRSLSPNLGDKLLIFIIWEIKFWNKKCGCPRPLRSTEALKMPHFGII